MTDPTIPSDPQDASDGLHETAPAPGQQVGALRELAEVKAAALARGMEWDDDIFNSCFGKGTYRWLIDSMSINYVESMEIGLFDLHQRYERIDLVATDPDDTTAPVKSAPPAPQNPRDTEMDKLKQAWQRLGIKDYSDDTELDETLDAIWNAGHVYGRLVKNVDGPRPKQLTEAARTIRHHLLKKLEDEAEWFRLTDDSLNEIEAVPLDKLKEIMESKS